MRFRVLLLLPLPALIPLLRSLVSAWSATKVPTGFIQYDMAYYMANAREHFDAGFSLTYRNPYALGASPPIYFQPHILVLGLLQQSGLDPGLVFNIFGIFAMAGAALAGFLLYRECVGLDTAARRIGLIAFFWGGGLLSLGGLAATRLTGHVTPRAAFAFDPMDGWWMFNFGRNLAHPTEAYYHAVFLGCMLMVIRQRHGWALALAALLSISHPFNGLSLALILTAYSLLELLIRRPLPGYFLPGALAVTAFHVGYYLWFLDRFPDHRALRAQWEIDWPYVAWSFVPALCFTGFFTFVRLTRWKTVQAMFADSRHRLFAVWFLVIFGLTQHDLILKPVQPIHFSHGYDWIALFFLGAPVLEEILNAALSIRARGIRAAVLAGFLLLFCSDNLIWFFSFWTPVQRYALELTAEQKGVLDWLRANATAETMVVTDDRLTGYLVATYSPARSWFGHDYNTPHAAERRREIELLFSQARLLDQWRDGRTWIVASALSRPPIQAAELYRNAGYVILAAR